MRKVRQFGWSVLIVTVAVSCTGGGGGGTPGFVVPNPDDKKEKVISCQMPSFEQVGIWKAVGGPIGGLGYNVRSPQGNADIIFVTDAWSGLQKSTDRGKTWNKANGSGASGITARDGASNDAIPVFSFKIDPNNSHNLWAGTQNGHGLFKSTDGGQTWVKSDNGINLNFDPNLLGLTIRHIEVEPGNSNIIYVMGEKPTGVKGLEFEKVSGFIYKSTDAGANFSLLKNFDSLTRWMFINPSNTQEMIVFTGIFDREADTVDSKGIGVFRSIDGGATWVSANTGISSAHSRFIGGADQHPTQPGTFIIAAGNNADTTRNPVVWGAVYKTTDFGQSWTDITPSYNSGASKYQAVFTAVAFSKKNPSIVYVGSEQAVYRSSDGGATWNRYGGENGGPWGPEGIRAGFPIDMIVDQDNSDIVYINNYGGGVFRSTDGGMSWESWSQGYSGADLRGVSVNAKGCVWVNGRSGAFLSQDGANTWEGLKSGIASFIAEGGAVLHDRSDKSNRTFLKADAQDGKIYRTVDGGIVWTASSGLPSPSGEPGSRHGAIKIVQSYSDPRRMYAVYMQEGYRFSDPHNMTLKSSYGVYRSDDGGVSWFAVNQGLPNGGASSGDRNISDIAVSFVNKDIVYISLYKGGVYKTNNGGGAWTSMLGNLPAGESWSDEFDPLGAPIPRSSVLSINVASNNESEILIGTNVHGVYKTVDAGANWIKLLSEATMTAGSSKDHAHTMSIVRSSTDPNTIFVADWHSGVFKSTNAGASWARVNTGLSTRAVNVLTLTNDGKWLYAATQGEGVFRMRNF